jgi:hypothetical protein
MSIDETDSVAEGPSGEIPHISNSERKTALKKAWTRFGFVLPIFIYLVFTQILGPGRVGLQYDEALLQHGAVKMLCCEGGPAFGHDAGSWVTIGGHWFPLTVLPYMGAVKHYLVLGPFALFGPTTKVGRMVNVFLGLLGVLGITLLVQHEVGVGAGIAAGSLLAIHPSYLDQTLFDNGAVGVWMAAMGLICIAVCRYRTKRSAGWAFFGGLMAGVGIWHRVNFAWLLAALLIAAVIVLRKKIVIPIWHALALTAGAFLGVLPILVYQLRSDWAILKFMELGKQQDGMMVLAQRRLGMIAETMISDAEQRSIWAGGPVPDWQSICFFGLVLLAVSACIVVKGGEKTYFRRTVALTLVIFAVVMLTSKLNIAHHHLVALVPVSVIVVVAAVDALIAFSGRLRLVAAGLAILFASVALYWNIAAAKGIRATRGVNMWSSAIYDVHNYLESNHAGQQIGILDWGLQNNLYMLSEGRLKTKELFWGATDQRSATGAGWLSVIGPGGVFLTNAPENRHFPTASLAFFAALKAAGRQFEEIEFKQKSGAGYAILVVVAPPGQASVFDAQRDKADTGPR